MEATGKKAAILLGLMVAMACCTDAQTICNMTYAQLMSCKPAATPPNPPPPTSACCAGLSCRPEVLLPVQELVDLALDRGRPEARNGAPQQVQDP
ncbi:hypothetical protein NL676_021544 [Syzygium grande]|nr:hypothetical protein NL676_021544 [Syzygium grande]